jgi:hypothetical protein
VAAKGVLGDLNPLGDSPCHSLALAARVCQKYCPQRNLKASSLGSSLLCLSVQCAAPPVESAWRSLA